VFFTSDGRRNKKIDTRVVEANPFLREFHRSVVTKRELSNTAKLSVFKSVFVPILTYGREFWAMTEKISSNASGSHKMQAATIKCKRQP